MNNAPVQSSCAVIRQWEEASTLLATALATHLESCFSLETKYILVPASSTDPELVDRIDSQLIALHSVMARQLSQSRLALARTRNRIMSPLCNFPLEILSEIFLNVIYLPDPGQPAVRTMEDGILSIYKSIHNLLGVCSVWRNVVQSRAAFWSLIPIFYPTLDPPGHRATNLSLQRAGDGPLHLAAVISRASSPTVKTLREYIHRFSSINLLSETRSPINEVIKLLLWNNTPLFLRELSIRHVGESAAGKRLPRESEYLISDESFIDHDRFKRLVQSLSAFRMSGIPIHWNTVTFSSQLVELMLDGVTLGFESEVGRFLGALSSATRLRDLRITSVVVFPENLTIDGTDAEDSRVELPSLKTLFFGNLYYNTMRSFSRRLAPGSYHLSLLLTQYCTRTCTIESGDFELMGALFDELCDLVDELGVDMLLLDGNWDEDGDERWLTPDQLSLLLGFTPNLTNLKMNCCNFDAEHWMALTRTGGHPMLENLSLTCASILDQEGIKNVVTSHQLQRLELGGLVYNLPGCKVLQGGDDIVDWLERNVPNFRLVSPDHEPTEFKETIWNLW